MGFGLFRMMRCRAGWSGAPSYESSWFSSGGSASDPPSYESSWFLAALGHRINFSARMIRALVGMVVWARMVLQIILVNIGLTRMVGLDHPKFAGGLG